MLRANMGFAHREPNVLNGLWANFVTGFTPMADRPLCHDGFCALHYRGCVSFGLLQVDATLAQAATRST